MPTFKQLKTEFMQSFWDYVGTGYFARAVRDYELPNDKPVTSNVHLVYKKQPLCGYVPHKTMHYQFCSSNVTLDHVTCDKCKEIYEQEKAEKANQEPEVAKSSKRAGTADKKSRRH